MKIGKAIMRIREIAPCIKGAIINSKNRPNKQMIINPISLKKSFISFLFLLIIKVIRVNVN